MEKKLNISQLHNETYSHNTHINTHALTQNELRNTTREPTHTLHKRKHEQTLHTKNSHIQHQAHINNTHQTQVLTGIHKHTQTHASTPSQTDTHASHRPQTHTRTQSTHIKNTEQTQSVPHTDVKYNTNK